jgi:excisionase family DNA binding protein
MQAATQHIEDRDPIAASQPDREALAALDRLLSGDDAAVVRIVGTAGEEQAVPPALLRVLRRVVRIMAREQAVSVLPVEKELTTQQAADLLNISRPYLIQLLDRGEIPHTMTGTHRRLMLDDVLAYKRQRDQWRREGLRALARASKEMGLYDLEEV